MDRFLIIRTSSLGDIIHGMPVAAAIKAHLPDSRISWIVEERFKDLLTGLSWVDDLIPVQFKEGLSVLADAEKRELITRTRKLLKRRKFDVTIDLQGLIRSGLISRSSCAPIRIGFPQRHARESLNHLFSNVTPKKIPVRGHIVDKNLALLHPLGIYTQKRTFSFWVPEDVNASMDSFFAPFGSWPGSPRVVIHPAAGGITKQWSPGRYAEIADRLIQAWKAKVFLLWGPGELDLVKKIQGIMRHQAWLAPETDIKGLIAFLQRADIFIGGDSGPLHIASALEKSIVGLYGYSDPVRNGPFMGQYDTLRTTCPGSPCYRKSCTNTACLDRITVNQVWDVLTRLLQKKIIQEFRKDNHGI